MLPISSVASASFQYQCGFAETSAFTVVMTEALSLHGMFCRSFHTSHIAENGCGNFKCRIRIGERPSI